MSEFSNVYLVQLVYNVGTSVTGRTDIKAFLIIISKKDNLWIQ